MNVDDAGLYVSQSLLRHPVAVEAVRIASFQNTEATATEAEAESITTSTVHHPISSALINDGKICIDDEKRLISTDDISSEAVVEEPDTVLLNTTTFSDPDFDCNTPISLENISTKVEASQKPKMNSILHDATNRIRARRGRAGPMKAKGEDGIPLALTKRDIQLPDQNDKENVQFTRDKFEQNPVPIKVRFEESERVTMQDTPVTEPVMTFFEDDVDLDDTDGSVFDSENTPTKQLHSTKDGLHMNPATEETTCEGEVPTPVISNKSALILLSTKEEVKNSTEVFRKVSDCSVATSDTEEDSFMEVRISFDGSFWSEGMSSCRKMRQDDKLLQRGFKDNKYAYDCNSVENDGIVGDLIAAVNEMSNIICLNMAKLSC
jgi:hypothetical protein